MPQRVACSAVPSKRMIPMRLSCLFALWWLLLFPAHAWQTASPQAAAGPEPPTRVVVLGVDHAVQLVAERDRAGMLAAFVDRVAPDAVCVERAPEPFTRGDHYEFTYEIQDVLLPHARARGIALCPFDWEPPHEDQLLGWGVSLSQPPEIRAREGFQGFLSFPEPRKLARTLFFAEDRAALADVEAWIATPARQAARDLPRRMFLYRTFLQARRIAAAARQWRGGTLLVVVGEFHKHDLEAILADDPGIALVAPLTFGTPSADEAGRATTRAHRIAVASFNLLGVQAATGNVDRDWVGRELDALERERRDPETALLRTRHDLLGGRIDYAAAAARYRAIAADGDAVRRFTWDGVRDRNRLDSYFDPFGNLRVDQRARLELARTLHALGDRAGGDAMLDALRDELAPRQARQFDAYRAREADAVAGPVLAR